MVNCQFFHSCFRLTLSPDILYNVLLFASLYLQIIYLTFLLFASVEEFFVDTFPAASSQSEEES
jgi:hypothetical protein